MPYLLWKSCKIFSLQNIHNHVRKHFKILINFEISTNKEDYFAQTEDFEMVCRVPNCGKRINLCIKYNLTKHLSSKIYLDKVKSRLLDARSLSNVIKELLQNFIIWIKNAEARCKFSNFQDCYIFIATFEQHVERHLNVFLYEKVYGQR